MEEAKVAVPLIIIGLFDLAVIVLVILGIYEQSKEKHHNLGN